MPPATRWSIPPTSAAATLTRAWKSLAVHSLGTTYLTGLTFSTNFPTANPFQAANAADAFLTKLNAAGNALVYSTYLGGSNTDEGFGIAVDSLGSAYLTGVTVSTNFPTAHPIQANGGGVEAFVTKVNAAGNALVYSTYLGGSSADAGHGIAVDSLGSAYVTGLTESTNFPTANPIQAANGGSNDAFVTKLVQFGASTAFCEVTVTQGGWIIADNGDLANFGGNAKVSADGSSVQGQEQYQDKGPAQPLN